MRDHMGHTNHSGPRRAAAGLPALLILAGLLAALTWPAPYRPLALVLVLAELLHGASLYVGRLAPVAARRSVEVADEQ